MPKLNEQGDASIIDCRPKYMRAGSRAVQQRNLFQPPPPRQLEPTYNGAYEGYGYPAAGYGQSRRQVVPLAIPKVQTTYGAALIGTRITTQGTLNPRSDANTRAEVASLMGLGCHCSPIDHKFVAAVGGLGVAVTGPNFYTDRKGKRVYVTSHSTSGALHGLGQDLTTVQQFADAITQNVVPNSLLNRIADKIISDEKANAVAYANIQKLKSIDPQNRAIETLQRAQQTAWGETNTAKFYALLIPEMQPRLVGKVTPPDYRYIKAGDAGVFTKVANFLREKVVGDAARNLIAKGYMTESLAGLGALPLVPVVAVVVAGALIAFLASKTSDAIQANSRAALVNTCATGKVPKAACVAALEGNKDTDWSSVALYGAIGIGGLVALQVISSIRSAFPGR